jgi:hypothetical protein
MRNPPETAISPVPQLAGHTCDPVVADAVHGFSCLVSGVVIVLGPVRPRRRTKHSLDTSRSAQIKTHGLDRQGGASTRQHESAADFGGLLSFDACPQLFTYICDDFDLTLPRE